MSLTKIPYLVFFAILLVGVTSAYAVITITLQGSTVVMGDLDVLGPITSQTISDLDSRISILEGNP